MDLLGPLGRPFFCTYKALDSLPMGYYRVIRLTCRDRPWRGGRLPREALLGRRPFWAGSPINRKETSRRWRADHHVLDLHVIAEFVRKTPCSGVVVIQPRRVLRQRLHDAVSHSIPQSSRLRSQNLDNGHVQRHDAGGTREADLREEFVENLREPSFPACFFLPPFHFRGSVSIGRRDVTQFCVDDRADDMNIAVLFLVVERQHSRQDLCPRNGTV